MIQLEFYLWMQCDFSCSVDVLEDRISVFDSGPGMDSSKENSIAKWWAFFKCSEYIEDVVTIY